ncbi:MAG: DUF2141 domain-containing protein [Candidatus Acidiferrales bacterium]
MMRTTFRRNYSIVVIGALCAVFLITTAQSRSAQMPATATLKIKVVGARNAKGKIGVTLFQDASGFPDNTSNAIRQQAVEIDPNTLTAQVIFSDVPQGIYAVSVLHDENLNGKLDKNFMGIPKEGYGASNNPAKKRRAPTFDEAKFSLDAPEQTIEIKLIY